MTSVRRLLRIVFNTLTVLSVVLAVLVAGLWVRSYYAREEVRWSYAHDRPQWSEWGDWTFTNGRGQVRLDRRYSLTTGLMAFPSEVVPGFRYEWSPPMKAYSGPIDSPGPAFEAFGFVWDPQYAVMPTWAAFALTALLPLLQGASLLRHRRREASGACPACGYDLRATPERCPECGASANPAVA